MSRKYPKSVGYEPKVPEARRLWAEINPQGTIPRVASDPTQRCGILLATLCRPKTLETKCLWNLVCMSCHHCPAHHRSFLFISNIKYGRCEHPVSERRVNSHAEFWICNDNFVRPADVKHHGNWAETGSVSSFKSDGNRQRITGVKVWSTGHRHNSEGRYESNASNFFSEMWLH
jgi:hypothetical protein